ncbi:hypothetical protein [Vibrio sp. 10N.222.49.C9]|uniref:hypothetical protein n=1 Tax=Vibrio sp. 10N.222.49.C9 TaxID=3229615 RepID=UPI003551B6C6
MPAKKAPRKKRYQKKEVKLPFSRFIPKNNPIILAPTHVDIIDSNFDDENALFLERLRIALSNSNEVTISFKETKSLKATALLVIYSFVDTSKKGKKINVVYSDKSEVVNRNIKSSGDFKSSEDRLTMLDDKLSPVIQGNNSIVIALSRKIHANLVELYLDKDDDDFTNRSRELGVAIMETLDNVGRHAYPEEPHECKHWWFCCDMIDDKLFMAIYDKGVGIPYSIKNSEIDFMKIIESYYMVTGDDLSKLPPTLTADTRRFASSYSDEALIRAAMSENLSKTTKDKHGKGSGSIKALIKNEKDSFLFISSGRGLYYYSKHNEEYEAGDIEEVHSLHNSIDGTLIQWSL